jgi:hypothetical protein
LCAFHNISQSFYISRPSHLWWYVYLITRCSFTKPNVVIDWLTLPRIWEVPGSNLRPETGYPDQDIRGLSQSLLANYRIMPWN